jgi:S1-C subfamily serine protease
MSPPAPPHTLLAHQGPETHAPDMLWLRAMHLANSGADVTLMRTRLAYPGVEGLVGSGVRIAHERGPDGFVGVRVLDVGDGSSAAARAGVEAGDRIEAVNGFPLTTPRDLEQASDTARGARALVLEILRNGRRILLRVEWRA